MSKPNSGKSTKGGPPLILPQKKQAYFRYNRQRFKKPLPNDYKTAATTLCLVEQGNVPLQEALGSKRNVIIKQAEQLVSIALERCKEIDYLLKQTELLSANKFLNQWRVKILIAEMLWGKQYLRSSAKEVEALKYYEEDLRELYTEVTAIICNPIDKDKFKLPTYVRINTLTISIEDSLRAFCKEGWNLLPRSDTYRDYLIVLSNLKKNDFVRDFHISELLVFPPGTSFYNHPGYLHGKFILQDKGSCLSSFLLNPKPDSVVLDICAAPGMTTNHLANIMGNKGLIFANDIHPARFRTLCKFLKATDVTCAKPIQKDYLNLKIEDLNNVKYVLIDPSCSKSGMFFNASKTPQTVVLRRNQFLLSMLLRFTLQTFPNLKRVVYTTCSLHPEEGEMIVDDALNEVGNSYSLLDVKEMLWNEWESMSLPCYVCSEKCLRIIPEADLCQGYFIAVFERNFDVPVPPYVRRFQKGGKVYYEDELAPNSMFKRKLANRQKRQIKKSIKFEYGKNRSNQQKPKFDSLKSTNTNNPSVSTSSTTGSQQISETTHNQLYP